MINIYLNRQNWFYYLILKSSRPEVFCKKVLLENSQNTCARDFFLLKHLHRCFPVNFAKFLRTPFFTKHLRWLLLYSRQKCTLYLLYSLRFHNFSVNCINSCIQYYKNVYIHEKIMSRFEHIWKSPYMFVFI